MIPEKQFFDTSLKILAGIFGILCANTVDFLIKRNSNSNSTNILIKFISLILLGSKNLGFILVNFKV